jgi:hypothetical protein
MYSTTLTLRVYPSTVLDWKIFYTLPVAASQSSRITPAKIPQITYNILKDFGVTQVQVWPNILRYVVYTCLTTTESAENVTNFGALQAAAGSEQCAQSCLVLAMSGPALLEFHMIHRAPSPSPFNLLAI